MNTPVEVVLKRASTYVFNGKTFRKGVAVEVPEDMARELLKKKDQASVPYFGTTGQATKTKLEKTSTETPKVSKLIPAGVAIETIATMTDADEVLAFTEGDSRATVRKAADEQIEALTQSAEGGEDDTNADDADGDDDVVEV